jgi:hypothetical protein
VSDPNLSVARDMKVLQDTLERLRKADVSALYPPWTQGVLNPFPLASSGGGWGYMAQPWECTILAFYCSVFVNTTNNATNFWTISLINAAGSTLASFTTAAIGAGVWTRFAVAYASIVQPSSSNAVLAVIATASLSPGSIFIVPAIAMLRNG